VAASRPPRALLPSRSRPRAVSTTANGAGPGYRFTPGGVG